MAILQFNQTCKGCDLPVDHQSLGSYMIRCECPIYGDKWISLYSKKHRPEGEEACPHCELVGTSFRHASRRARKALYNAAQVAKFKEETRNA